MRILMLAVMLALSACSTTHADTAGAVRNWKKTAAADCEKREDPIARQTCREQVAAVTTTQSRDDAKKGR